MGSNDPILSSPRVNTHSIVSLILGILTVVAFCGGMVPVPFSGIICFPISFLFGLLALVYGAVSLNGVRKRNEVGGFMAWTGILSGGLVFLCMICMVVIILSLFIFAPDSIQPIIEGYSA